MIFTVTLPGRTDGAPYRKLVHRLPNFRSAYHYGPPFVRPPRSWHNWSRISIFANCNKQDDPGYWRSQWKQFILGTDSKYYPGPFQCFSNSKPIRWKYVLRDACKHLAWTSTITDAVWDGKNGRQTRVDYGLIFSRLSYKWEIIVCHAMPCQWILNLVPVPVQRFSFGIDYGYNAYFLWARRDRNPRHRIIWI